MTQDTVDKDRNKAKWLLKSLKFINSGILAGVIIALVMIFSGFEAKDYRILTSIVSLLIVIGFVNLIVLLYYTGKAIKNNKNGK